MTGADCCAGEPAFGDPKGLHTADCPVYLANMDALERMRAEPGSRPVTAPNRPEPIERPWLNRGSDPVSERVYSLIFNGLTGALTDFMLLSERARISEAIYESLRTGGVEVRIGDGLARLREVAAAVPTTQETP